jgi:hypothetical protein
VSPATRALFSATLVGVALSRPALAEVEIAKANGWQLSTDGRVNAFLSYGFGDGPPKPLLMGEKEIPGGAGLNMTGDIISETNPDGSPVLNAGGNPKQGTFRSMRLRSGFVPNVLGINLVNHLSEETTIRARLAFWGTIESESQRKTTYVVTDAREAWGSLSGSWGTFLIGRSIELFARGNSENDFLYGHGYSLGFPGNVDNIGPTAGMIGFGVLAAFFAPGIVYATPSVGGLTLSAGVYDPAPLAGTYEATHDARPEAELAYDITSDAVRLHLFCSGEYQKVYSAGSTISATSYGVAYGGRFEMGPVHAGVGAHYGKGLGVYYALEADAVSVGPAPLFELRQFDGYSGFLQYAGGSFDIDLGMGISRGFQLDSDKADPLFSTFKSQIGYSAAVVYHMNKSFHFDVDLFHGETTWFRGEEQRYTFLNTGAVVTW